MYPFRYLVDTRESVAYFSLDRIAKGFDIKISRGLRECGSPACEILKWEIQFRICYYYAICFVRHLVFGHVLYTQYTYALIEHASYFLKIRIRKFYAKLIS